MIQVFNEEVSINYDGKIKTYKNYLLSSFLKKFVQKNFGAEDNFGMTVIYGIFNNDKEITINNNVSFNVPDFDNLDEIVPLNAYKNSSIYNIINTEINTTHNENEVVHVYRYKIYNVDNKHLKQQNSSYFGQKISYLLFGNLNEIYAILDIRDEEIIYNDTTNFDIFRRDKITTDCKFVSNDFTYPYHLSCFMETINNNAAITKIKNISFSYNYQKPSKVIPIDKLRVKAYNNKIFMSSDFTEVDIANSIYPKTTRHPMSNKYPMPHIIHRQNEGNMTPSLVTYSGSDEYPLEGNFTLKNVETKKRLLYPMARQNLYNKYPLKRAGNYKYVIIDYEVSSNDIEIGHYFMIYPLDFTGKLKINIEYERR